MFGKRAVELINEIANCSPENLPVYNVRPCTPASSLRSLAEARAPGAHLWCSQDELVRLVIEEVNEHYAQMSELVR